MLLGLLAPIKYTIIQEKYSQKNLCNHALPIFIFKDSICLNEWRRKAGLTIEKSSVCWFTPQVAVPDRAGPRWSWELSPALPHGWLEHRHWASFCCFLQAIIRHLDEQRSSQDRNRCPPAMSQHCAPLVLHFSYEMQKNKYYETRKYELYLTIIGMFCFRYTLLMEMKSKLKFMEDNHQIATEQQRNVSNTYKEFSRLVNMKIKILGQE